MDSARLPEDFTEARLGEEVKKTLKDKGKLKELLKNIKNATPEEMDNINNFANHNQNIRRAAVGMAAEQKEGKVLHNRDGMSNNAIKKIQQAHRAKQQAEAIAATLTAEDVKGVFINQKGKCSTNFINTKTIDEDAAENGKWVVHPIKLSGRYFIVVLGSECFTGKNKLVSQLLQADAFGPARVLAVGEDRCVPITHKEFEEILTNNNITFR